MPHTPYYTVLTFVALNHVSIIQDIPPTKAVLEIFGNFEVSSFHRIPSVLLRYLNFLFVFDKHEGTIQNKEKSMKTS